MVNKNFIPLAIAGGVLTAVIVYANFRESINSLLSPRIGEAGGADGGSGGSSPYDYSAYNPYGNNVYSQGLYNDYLLQRQLEDLQNQVSALSQQSQNPTGENQNAPGGAVVAGISGAVSPPSVSTDKSIWSDLGSMAVGTVAMVGAWKGTEYVGGKIKDAFTVKDSISTRDSARSKELSVKENSAGKRSGATNDLRAKEAQFKSETAKPKFEGTNIKTGAGKVIGAIGTGIVGVQMGSEIIQSAPTAFDLTAGIVGQKTYEQATKAGVSPTTAQSLGVISQAVAFPAYVGTATVIGASKFAKSTAQFAYGMLTGESEKQIAKTYKEEYQNRGALGIVTGTGAVLGVNQFISDVWSGATNKPSAQQNIPRTEGIASGTILATFWATPSKSQTTQTSYSPASSPALASSVSNLQSVRYSSGISGLASSGYEKAYYQDVMTGKTYIKPELVPSGKSVTVSTPAKSTIVATGTASRAYGVDITPKSSSSSSKTSTPASSSTGSAVGFKSSPAIKGGTVTKSPTKKK